MIWPYLSENWKAQSGAVPYFDFCALTYTANTAFHQIASLEGMKAIATKKLTVLSEQQIVDCAAGDRL